MIRSSKYLSQLIYASWIKRLGYSLQQFITHYHFGNLIYLSGNSHILENVEYLARGWISYPSVNTTSLYLNTKFSAFNCSTDTLVNEFAWLFIYLSRCLHQWLSNSWYVTACMHISQPHIIWCRWVIFSNCDGGSKLRAESLIWTSPFSSYAMENPVASFLACIYVFHGQILGEALSEVFQSSLLHLHHQTLL